MYAAAQPTADELTQLLGQCETALLTVRRTIGACPSDIIARVSLPPLEASLVHLAQDIRGWLDLRLSGPNPDTNAHHNVHHLPSIEHYHRLCDFVRHSNLSIIYPQAARLGLKLPRPPHSSPSPSLSLSSLERIIASRVAYVFALFVAQGLAVEILDRFQSSSSVWVGSGWVPHLCSLFATYVLVLQHQPSWVPTLCYLLAQGLCLRVAVLLDLWRIIGLLVVLVNILALSSSSVAARDVGL